MIHNKGKLLLWFAALVALLVVALGLGDSLVLEAQEKVPGKILIKKQTVPPGGIGFEFTDDIKAPNFFTLDHGGTKIFPNVSGTYAVTETNPAVIPGGWIFTGIDCVDEKGITWGVKQVATTTVVVSSTRQTVECIFTNKRPTVVGVHTLGAVEGGITGREVNVCGFGLLAAVFGEQHDATCPIFNSEGETPALSGISRNATLLAGCARTGSVAPFCHRFDTTHARASAVVIVITTTDVQSSHDNHDGQNDDTCEPGWLNSHGYVVLRRNGCVETILRELQISLQKCALLPFSERRKVTGFLAMSFQTDWAGPCTSGFPGQRVPPKKRRVICANRQSWDGVFGSFVWSHQLSRGRKSNPSQYTSMSLWPTRRATTQRC